jgi:hypothetical protein
MPSIDTKPELTAKSSMAQPVSQPAVYANGLKGISVFRVIQEERSVIVWMTVTITVRKISAYEHVTNTEWLPS